MKIFKIPLNPETLEPEFKKKDLYVPLIITIAEITTRRNLPISSYLPLNYHYVISRESK